MADANDTLELNAALDIDDGATFPLNDLPNDLLVSVFVTVRDLHWVRHTIPLVCKAWNELYRSQDASPLHETLEVDFGKEAVRTLAAREGGQGGGGRASVAQLASGVADPKTPMRNLGLRNRWRTSKRSCSRKPERQSVLLSESEVFFFSFSFLVFFIFCTQCVLRERRAGVDCFVCALGRGEERESVEEREEKERRRRKNERGEMFTHSSRKLSE